VYGRRPDLADPAELLHEASKIRPTLVVRQMRGVWALERSEHLQIATTLAVRRNPALPRVALPAAPLPPASLAAALERRRSTRQFGDDPVPLAALAAVLAAGYGVTRPAPVGRELPALRATPSAGALYPLEFFVVARRVEGLDEELYHYDPLRHELERIGPAGDLGRLSPHADIVEGAAAVLIAAAVFWRSRFKYGLRAYRFTLLEAGHAMQNVLLAATALELGSIVLGGFYDAKVDALLGLDGVDESSLVLACIGSLPR
jgi:SagB-type dehydrogenase family enzyme